MSIRSVSEEAVADGRFEDLPASNGVAPIADLKAARRRKPAASDSASVDRLPPHAPEAEQGVLGCLLLSPNDCIPVCITRLSDDGAFYDLRHQLIYANIVQMYDNRKPVDIITLQQRLSDFGMLENIGGIPYLSILQDCVPSAANLTNYLDILIEKYLLRRTIATCTDAISRAYDPEGVMVEDFIDNVEREVLSVRRGTSNQTTSVGMKESVRESMEDIEKLVNNKGEVTGISTGFIDLDRMTGGLNGGEMAVIAARPSLGKTSLAMNIADYVAVESRLPVGVFSLEMTRRALTMRMICSRARVNLRALSGGFTAEADYPRIATAAGRLSACPMQIDDTPGLSIMQLRARARMMWQMFGIKLFVVDYLQLACSSTKRGKENRQQEVSEISSGLKALAKELDVPVIVLSQLNRDVEKTKRKPMLSDLRESGSIEQDADLVAFLYNVELRDEGEEQSYVLPVNLLIAKQRNGPTGEVNLTFLKAYTRFESAAKVSDEEPPTEAENPML